MAFIAFFWLILGLAGAGVGIYLLYLVIRALQIYIRKNQ